MPIPAPIVFLVALVPALVAWWTGRGILARADDPALPELLLDRRRRMSRITLVGAIGLGVVAGSALVWALPLLWIALLVSGYPLRRTLFAERWSLPSFLRYAISSGIGQAGWQLIALFGPVIATVSALGSGGDRADALRIALWVGGYFATVAVVWQQFYARVWLDLHRATPLRASARPELAARLDAMLDRATLARRPEVYRFGAPGGHFVNALAIPSLTHPAVAMSDGLLATLTDDEIVAVFAHEVAHHEQFTRRKLWIGRIAGLLLALLSLGLPVGFIVLGPRAASIAAAAYCIVIFGALARGSARGQSHETKSDLRAAALTGNADAVASALTKLHISNRIPRRWPHAMESAATHPSLARRIQALRASAVAANQPLSPQAPLAIVRSSRGDAVVVLESARAHWFEGVPTETALELSALRADASSYRATVYADLTELRIGAAGNERTLIAVDRRGHAWSVPVASADVARLQAALDSVDTKLGPRPVALQPAGMAMARLLAIAALIALSVSGEAGIVLVPILFVLVRPALTAGVAAAGAVALGRALVAVMSFSWFDVSRQMGVVASFAAALALIGIAVVRVRDESRRDGPRRPAREVWLMIVLLGCIEVMLLMASVPGAIARPASLVSSPFAISAATTLAGIAAAFATIPGAWRRAGACLTGIAALAGGTLLAGSGTLYNRSAAIVWTKGTLEPAGSVALPSGIATTLELSPGGKSYAVVQYRPARRAAGPGNRYVIGRFGAGAPRVNDALQIAFLNDDTLLALSLHGTDSLELRAESVAGDSLGPRSMRWREVIPASELPRLVLDRARHVWIVFGRGEDGREILVATDSVGGRHPRIFRPFGQSANEVGELSNQPLAAFADGTVISLSLPAFAGTGGAIAPTLFFMGNPQWELRSQGPERDRLLADVDGNPICGRDVGPDGVVCAERSATRTRLWRIDPSSAEAIGDLPSSLDAVHPLGGSRVAAVERFGSRVAIADLGAGRAVRLTLPTDDPRTGADARWTSDIAAAGSYVALLSNGRASTLVRRYRIR